MRMNQTIAIEKPVASPAHLGWRLLAIIYDAVVAIALLMISSAIVVLINAGDPVTPGGLSSFFAFLFFWIVLGAYAILSWRIGGQTLGMRAWRLKVLTATGTQPSWKSLCAFWSLFDQQRRAFYDMLSGTALVRLHTN